MKNIAAVLFIFLLGVASLQADYASGLKAVTRGDHATALREWEPLAEQGDARGQNGLAWLYHRGLAVKQDFKIAFELYSLSANQGFAKAQANLGSMYRMGEGVAQNHVLALKWYKLAAAQEFAPAQFFLGEMYRKGLGTSTDYAAAIRWYERAAAERNLEAQNNPELRYYKGDHIIHASAQYRLGVMYYDGKGVTRDYTKSFQWFKQSAENGNPDAPSRVAKMYFLGEGVEQDLKAAYDWWSK